jgi:conjugal transfer pilus assembly protein TraB
MAPSGPKLEIITFASADKTPDSTSASAKPNPPPAPGATPSLNNSPSAALPLASAKPKGDFIPANTFAKASLLNGVDAPTGGQAQGQGFAGNPHPLHLHITSLANLPNLRKANLTDCRIMAAATGDISNERVYGRFETISCVLPSGQAIELPAKGHLIGEDGKYGIRGTLVSKAGQVIAAQILAEFARGIGNGFRQAATIQTSTAFGVTQIPDNSRIGQAAIGSGIAGGANALATYYTNLSNKLFPVIEVAAGREVEVVFSQGVQMPGSLDGTESAVAAQHNPSPSTARGAIHDQE